MAMQGMCSDMIMCTFVSKCIDDDYQCIYSTVHMDKCIKIAEKDSNKVMT